MSNTMYASVINRPDGQHNKTVNKNRATDHNFLLQLLPNCFRTVS